MTWSVATEGQGPVCLLLHGTGASKHSWGGLIPHLAAQLTLIMPDLPGHGATRIGSNQDLTLPGMAKAISALLTHLRVSPEIIIGHSAGTAVALDMVHRHLAAPRGVIGLNAALVPYGGAAAAVFQPLARLLTLNPFMAGLLAAQASEKRVTSTLAGTGSNLSPEQIAAYQRLFANPVHVQSALRMMAGWDLATLTRAFPLITCPVTLIATAGDRAVPPEQAFTVAKQLPNATVVYHRSGGHLAHEEDPAAIASLLRTAIAAWLHAR